MDLLRSLPLGLYLEQPLTWLHQLDARVKLAWLLTFLVAPVLANTPARLVLALILVLLTLSARIPWRVWRQQLGWLSLLCVFVLILTAIAPDGLSTEHQLRLPENELSLSLPPDTPPPAELQQPTDYRYLLVEIRQPPVNLTVSRRSLDLGLRLATLLFTLIYSTNLFLLTTAPEEITAGIESLMAPLRRFNLPVTEIALTLTLSLRFIPLVLEEIQNLVRSVRTRAINWKKLGLRRAAQVWLLVAERLISNLLLRAEQIASAMTVRGFTSPDRHRVKWHQEQLRLRDWIAIAMLALLWVARFIWGNQL